MTEHIENRLFIGNEWVSSSEKLSSVNPADESVVGEVCCAGKDEVDAAVSAARRALNGEWRKTKPWERGRALMKIAEIIKERENVLAKMEMNETGKPAKAALGAVRAAARYFEFYAGVADKIQGTTVPIGEDYVDFTLREPLGVTAHILPWNVPLNMLARGVAPALAAGCTAVVKPAEQTPHGALQLAEIFVEAGLPAGTVNIINGLGETTGGFLSSHPDIDGLTFTGSVSTGVAVMRACAEHIKPVVLELGGKSPIVVFSDASPDVVAKEACKGIYSNTGQYCDAGSRLLLDAKIHDAVMDELVTRSGKIKVGMPSEDPDMGPLISAEQHSRVMDYIQRGKKGGAVLALGGERPADLSKGYFVQPTVFDQVAPQADIAREEIFGPVLAVSAFDDEEEALNVANGTDFGLAAGVFTRDMSRAMRMAKRLEAGTVYINEYFAGEMASPFGGVKKSGIGRERGLETLANYTRVKNVVINIGG